MGIADINRVCSMAAQSCEGVDHLVMCHDMKIEEAMNYAEEALEHRVKMIDVTTLTLTNGSKIFFCYETKTNITHKDD